MLTNFLGGTSYLATGYALRGFSAFDLVFWRTFLSALFFLPLAVKAARRADLTRGDWLRMAAAGSFGMAAPLLIGTIGQKYSSATNASLLIAMEPISVVFLAALFLREKLTGRKMLALAFSIFGSSLIVLQGIPFWSTQITPHLYGDLLLILHGFLWALYSVIGKPVLRKVDPLTFSVCTTVLGFIPVAVAALFLKSQITPLPASWEVWAGLAYLGAAVGVLGVWTWNKSLELVPASKMINFVFLQPLLGVVSGTLLLNDEFTVWSGCGGALIIFGVYCAMKEPDQASAPAAAFSEKALAG